MDHHTVAAVSIVGTCLDVLGSLYLAYDLLGGQHGPLRLLTRAVTYAVIFGIGYGLGLGLFFGLASGIATGVTLAIAILITLGQIFAYSRGMRPALDYSASRRPRLTRRRFWGTVVRTLGYIATALICSALIRHVQHAWSFAIRVGLVTGIVTGVGATINPYIEYYADNLPERRLGVFGIVLILCGFALQSLQYCLAFFTCLLRYRAKAFSLRRRARPLRYW